MRTSIFCLTAALALTCASCGKSTIYPVSGKVFCNGVPATGAAVFFRRRAADPMNEHLIMGIVRNDGSFELVCGPLGKGAPPGEYDVLIEWKPASASKDKGPGRRGADKLNGRYADPKRPRLRATVEPKINDLAPFEVRGESGA